MKPIYILFLTLLITANTPLIPIHTHAVNTNYTVQDKHKPQQTKTTLPSQTSTALPKTTLPGQTSTALPKTTLPGQTSKALPGHTAPAEQPSDEFPLDKQIQIWIQTLAKEAKFTAWENAEWQSHPLGPGMHGWVVLIYSKGQEAGYLIVHSTPDGGLQLSEYGVGSNPLFSLNALNRTMVQHELIPSHSSDQGFLQDSGLLAERIYINSFQAVWKLHNKDNVYYFDAVTGEAFPITSKNIEQLWNEMKQPDGEQSEKQKITQGDKQIDNQNDSPKLVKSALHPAFDPFEQINWITNDPLVINGAQDLIDAVTKEKNKITYTASIFDDNALIPLAVVGYHHWDLGKSYIALEHLGTRYIPYTIVRKQGEFYLRK
jgi:hypothetical protein